MIEELRIKRTIKWRKTIKEEDGDPWVKEHPGVGWQEYLQAKKLPDNALAAKMLSTLLKDALLLIL